jgi:hypothetical protein
VQTTHAISVEFAIDTFTVTAISGSGGEIDPSGAQVVNYDTTPTYTLKPDSGYSVSLVTVDGVKVDPTVDNTYTFPNVLADHLILVQFSADSLIINAGAGAGGEISPEGSVPVLTGSD